MSVNSALVRFIVPRAQLGTGDFIDHAGGGDLFGGGAFDRGGNPVGGVVALAVHLQRAVWRVAVVLALRSLPDTPRSGHRFDLVSALLNAATFGLLLVGLDGDRPRAGSAWVAVELLAGWVVGRGVHPAAEGDGRTDVAGGHVRAGG